MVLINTIIVIWKNCFWMDRRKTNKYVSDDEHHTYKTHRLYYATDSFEWIPSVNNVANSMITWSTPYSSSFPFNQGGVLSIVNEIRNQHYLEVSTLTVADYMLLGLSLIATVCVWQFHFPLLTNMLNMIMDRWKQLTALTCISSLIDLQQYYGPLATLSKWLIAHNMQQDVRGSREKPRTYSKWLC